MGKYLVKIDGWKNCGFSCEAYKIHENCIEFFNCDDKGTIMVYAFNTFKSFEITPLEDN